MIENNNYCLICNSNVIEHVISNGYKYYKCNNCASSQLLPQPSNEELHNYYSKFHLPEEFGGGYDWVEERMRIDFDSKLKLINSYTRNTRLNLLDVGCGKGFFVLESNKKGFTATGIDISISGIEYSKNTLKINTELKSIQELAADIANNEKFDVITLWATIEHVPYPQNLLASINYCLKKKGYLFLDTGLGNDKFEKFLTGHSQWYDALQHLFVFSEKGLKILLAQAGFDILKVDKNFERSRIRKYTKFTRHLFISLSSYLLLRPILGKTGFMTMQKESKWPIGKLIQIVAQKN